MHIPNPEMPVATIVFGLMIVCILATACFLLGAMITERRIKENEKKDETVFIDDLEATFYRDGVIKYPEVVAWGSGLWREGKKISLKTEDTLLVGEGHIVISRKNENSSHEFSFLRLTIEEVAYGLDAEVVAKLRRTMILYPGFKIHISRDNIYLIRKDSTERIVRLVYARAHGEYILASYQG